MTGSELLALLALIVATLGLGGSWWIAGRRGAHRDGVIETRLEAVDESVKVLGNDSRLAWGSLRQDMENDRRETSGEIDELRRQLSERDQRMWERFDAHNRAIATLEANQKAGALILQRYEAFMRKNGRS